MQERTREDEYKRRIEQLVSDRGVFNSHWDEISKFVRPDAASFTGTNNTPGQKKGQMLLDAVGAHSNQLLAAGFYSLLTNPQTKWFELTTTNAALRDSREVRIWLSDASDALLTEIQRPQTGFQTALHEAYLDHGAYGNGVIFVTTKPDRVTLSFQALPLQECYFVEGQDGQVVALYRRYVRTVQALVDFFGLENVAKEVRDKFDSGQYLHKHTVLHVIEPNRYAYMSGKAKHLPYASIYMDLDHKHIMRESGFQERPFMACRFNKTSYEVYGRGPGSTALADLKTLNEIMKTTLRGAQKAVDPPLLVPDNAFVTPPHMVPGGISYYRPDNPADKITPVQTGADPRWGLEIATETRNRIRQMFYVDQLQLNEGPQMTATEVIQRTEEKMRLMGPVIGRAITELLSPLIERSFHLMLRAGQLPEPPAELIEAGPRLKVVYLSPLVKAQDQSEANALLRVTQLMSPFLSVDPTAMDVFNTDALARHLIDIYAVNPRVIRTETEVDQVREARAQQQQEASMAQMLQAGGSGFNAITAGMANLQDMQQ